MKVLEIIPTLNKIGGGETFFTDLCIKMNKKVKLFVVVLYKSNNNFLNKLIKESGIEIIYLNKKRGIDIRCAHELRKAISLFKPDVIHCHLRSLLTLRLSFLFKRKIPIFFTVHNIFGENFKNEWLDSILIRKRFVIPVGVCNEVSKSIKRHTGVDSRTIYNGLNVEKYDAGKKINERTIDFIVVGSFYYLKNQIYAIKCFERIAETNPNLNIHFLGDGSDLTVCKEYVKTKNIKNVYFHGVVNNVNEFLADSKILLLPSLTEANPICVHEAIVSGCYIISNNVGGVGELVNKRNGKLVRINDYESFCTAMLSSINDNYLLEETRKYSEETRESHSINYSLLQYLDLFKDF